MSARPGQRRRRRWRLAFPLALPVALAVVAGCGQSQASPPVAPTPPPAPVRVMAVGDSITEADSANFDQGQIGPGSWASYAGSPGTTILGGCGHAGHTTGELLDRMRGECGERMRAAHPDLLVVMAGTNDILRGLPDDAAAANLEQITALAGVRRVVLSTVPPLDSHPDEGRRFNEMLASLARQHGWRLADPMGPVRDEEGRFRPGTSPDGIHPDEAAARLIGEGLRPALVR